MCVCVRWSTNCSLSTQGAQELDIGGSQRRQEELEQVKQQLESKVAIAVRAPTTSLSHTTIPICIIYMLTIIYTVGG